MVTKMDEEADERRREMGLLRNHIQKEREEMRGQLGKQTTRDFVYIFPHYLRKVAWSLIKLLSTIS